MDENEKTPQKYSYKEKLDVLQLAEEIGVKEAAAKLGISVYTIYRLRKAAREGRLRATVCYRAQGAAVSIIEDLDVLRKRIKTLERENYILSSENNYLRSLNDFLSASFREDGKESPVP